MRRIQNGKLTVSEAPCAWTSPTIWDVVSFIKSQPDGSTKVRELQRPYMKEAVDPATGTWRPKRDCEIRGYSDQDPHIDFYQHLYAAIAGREPVPASPEDARDAIQVIWLAIESAQTGRVMNWS